MAEQPETQPEAKTGGRKSRLIPAIIVLMLMGFEGVGVFFLAKSMSGPEMALGGTDESEGGGQSPSDPADWVEIDLAECRPTNNRSGRTVTLHIRVSALVAAKDLEAAEELVEAKKGRIEDRVNIVIRSADPRHLNEPGTETIRRRLQHELEEVFGEDLKILEILVPHFQQSGS